MKSSEEYPFIYNFNILEIIQENDCFLINFEQNKSSAHLEYVNMFYFTYF